MSGIEAPSEVAGITRCDVLVVGAGAAGLSAALACAPLSVTLLTKARLGAGGASPWAQGGVASAFGSDDSPSLHAADTIAAGAGLNEPEVVALLTGEGPQRMRALLALGARFDRKPSGQLALGREAAHSRRRIVHAQGDATGAEIVRTLDEAVARASHIRVVERTFAADLVLDRGEVAGVVALSAGGPGGQLRLHLARAVVLATGGSGRLFLRTTNPPEATADGLAMAARAGARLVDLEFVQFHPTALAVPDSDEAMPLLSEALRGEGAVLLDGRGKRFMTAEHADAELAPRDVVARAIWRRLVAGERVVLDARQAVGEDFPRRFPTVFRLCMGAGIDPRCEPIPVSPAAHYHMGGVATDVRGRTSLPGLWACGEVAATGAHGANRLASNSLLEALVFGARVGEDVRRSQAATASRPRSLPAAGGEKALGRLGSELPPAAVQRLRHLMWESVGVERDAAGLTAASSELEAITGRAGRTWAGPAAPGHTGRDETGLAAGGTGSKTGSGRAGEPGNGLADVPPPAPPGVELAGSGRGNSAGQVAALEARNLLAVARLVTAAALARQESRGGHFRRDFPEPDPAWQHRLFLSAARDGTAVFEDPALPSAACARAARRSEGQA